MFIIRSNPVVQFLKNLGSSITETGRNVHAIEAAIGLWAEYDVKVRCWASQGEWNKFNKRKQLEGSYKVIALPVRRDDDNPP
jgi:hypothetical protein